LTVSQPAYATVTFATAGWVTTKLIEHNLKQLMSQHKC